MSEAADIAGAAGTGPSRAQTAGLAEFAAADGAVLDRWKGAVQGQWGIVPVVYYAGWAFCRFTAFCCLRIGRIDEPGSRPEGGYVLCCTHLSHLEPVIVSSLLRRRVEWMSRIEFYKYKVGAWALDALGAFRVKRQGVPVTAMRTAIRRAREGCIVGIFPEGGVVKGAESACRGGAIKRGACMAACEAGVPIVPVVVLGTDRLNEVKPWLPFKHGKVWVIFGSPIPPRPAPGGRANARVRKAEREAMARELSAEYVRLAGVLRERFGLGEGAIP